MNDDDRQFLEALQRLRLHLRARAIDSPEGGRLTSATGGRIDFHSHRRYERRDPPRALDWRVFARTGALVAKELVDERSVEFHLFIDNSGSMGLGTPSKVHIATRFALGVCYLALSAGATVTVWTAVAPSGRAAQHASRPLLRRISGQQRIPRLWQSLVSLRGVGSLQLHSTLTEWATQLPPRCEAVVISDFLCPTLRAQSFAGLGRERHAALVQVLSADDVRPEVSGPMLLQDSETGQSRLLIVDASKRLAHAQRVKQCTAVAQTWCQRNHQRWLSHEPSASPLERVRAFAQT